MESLSSKDINKIESLLDDKGNLQYSAFRIRETKDHFLKNGV